MSSGFFLKIRFHEIHDVYIHSKLTLKLKQHSSSTLNTDSCKNITSICIMILKYKFSCASSPLSYVSTDSIISGWYYIILCILFIFFIYPVENKSETITYQCISGFFSSTKLNKAVQQQHRTFGLVLTTDWHSTNQQGNTLFKSSC